MNALYMLGIAKSEATFRSVVNGYLNVKMACASPRKKSSFLSSARLFKSIIYINQSSDIGNQ